MGTTNARVWAEEFCRIFKGRMIVVGGVDEFQQQFSDLEFVDEGTMIGWFANAMAVAGEAGHPGPHRRFVLDRHEDETGVSGTGVVAEGVEFSDGVVCLRWVTPWPSSVCHYERGMESVEMIHGHGGKTEIRFIDG